MFRKDYRGFKRVNAFTYTMKIYYEDNSVFCKVYGRTLEECGDNVNKILEL